MDHIYISKICKAFYLIKKKHDVHYSYCPIMTLTNIEEEMSLVDKNEETIHYAKTDVESLLLEIQTQ